MKAQRGVRGESGKQFGRDPQMGDNGKKSIPQGTIQSSGEVIQRRADEKRKEGKAYERKEEARQTSPSGEKGTAVRKWDPVRKSRKTRETTPQGFEGKAHGGEKKNVIAVYFMVIYGREKWMEEGKGWA